MVIGITGNSGVGKTTISEQLAKKMHAQVINADILAKQLSKKGTAYYKDIVNSFGEEILNKDKEINRGKLADIIFTDHKKLELINKITNKHVVSEIIREIEDANGDIVIDVPLLFENNMQDYCDITISILADEESKLKRISRREHISKEQIQKRLSIQKKDEYYKQKSSIVIFNNEDNDIKEIVEEVYRKICIKLGKN